MIYTGNLDLSPSHRHLIETDGVNLYKTMLIDVDHAMKPAPSGHLIEQAAGVTIRAHFHGCSQFQIFINGSGRFGQEKAEPFMVHYSRAHTGYGPIVAGEHGLWYMTLRPTPRFGAQYLPESRPQMDNSRPKYQVSTAPFAAGSATPENPVVEMTAPRDDGLAVWMVHVPANQSVKPPQHAGGRARYYLVAKGGMLVDGKQMGALSLTWTEGTDLDQLQAGADGLDVVIMQFPGDAF